MQKKQPLLQATATVSTLRAQQDDRSAVTKWRVDSQTWPSNNASNKRLHAWRKDTISAFLTCPAGISLQQKVYVHVDASFSAHPCEMTQKRTKTQTISIQTAVAKRRVLR